MDLELEPIVKVRTYEEVVHRIQEQILEGRLKAGDRLPGERELSERLGVSRPTIREALRVLETLQILRVPGRTGPEGGAVVEGRPGELLERLLTLQLALSHYSMTDFVQTRCAVEGAAAALAAEVASAEQVDRLTAIIESMETQGHDRARAGDLDTDFHASLGDASGNPLLAHLMRAIRGAMRHEMMQGFQQVQDWGAIRERLNQEHRAILDAVVDGDPGRAAEAVRTHIMDFEPRWEAHSRASEPTGGDDGKTPA